MKKKKKHYYKYVAMCDNLMNELYLNNVILSPKN